MLQLDGTVKWLPSSRQIRRYWSTTLFELEVQEAAAPDDSEIEKDEDYGILIQLIADVQAIKDAEAKNVSLLRTVEFRQRRVVFLPKIPESMQRQPCQCGNRKGKSGTGKGIC